MNQPTQITMTVSSNPTGVPPNHMSAWQYSLGNWANDSYDLYDKLINIGDSWSPAHFTNTSLTLIPAWINNHIHYKVWDEISYPIPNFNGITIEAWEWISNFISQCTMYVTTYPCWD